MFDVELSSPRCMRHHRGTAVIANALIFALFILLSFTGCSETGEALESGNSKEDSEVERKDSDGKGEEDKEELPPVEVVSLKHGEIEAVLRFSTNLEAESVVQCWHAAFHAVQ